MLMLNADVKRKDNYWEIYIIAIFNVDQMSRIFSFRMGAFLSFCEHCLMAFNEIYFMELPNLDVI